MTTLALQMIFDNVNGAPADKVMNTWHCKTNDMGDPGDEASDFLAGKLAPFYDAIEGYMSAFLSGAYVCRAFDLSDPEPRVPVLEQTGSISPGPTSLYPCEIAVCLSFQGERASGSPQARRRGRVYIGPLARDAPTLAEDSTAGDMIVAAGFRAALTSAAADLGGVFIGPGSGSSIAWCTFSPTDVADGKTLAQASQNVTDGWVDFAVDIQRRRGHAPGGRTLFTV
jgi:hypothetical protein